MQTLAIRLNPARDLKMELDALARREKWEAACILTCVGSLTKAALRFADRSETKVLEGHFEIVSLVGTLSQHGSHLHLSISDGGGVTLGGHLKEGCLVYTTAEIVIGVIPGVRFLRKPDPGTGFVELSIEPTEKP